MSFFAQIAPSDIRNVRGWWDPETGTVFVRLAVGNLADEQGYDGLTFVANPSFGDDLASLRAFLGALIQAVDDLDPAVGSRQRTEVPWPPAPAEGGAPDA